MLNRLDRDSQALTDLHVTCSAGEEFENTKLMCREARSNCRVEWITLLRYGRIKHGVAGDHGIEGRDNCPYVVGATF